jgi:putative endonuclease
MDLRGASRKDIGALGEKVAAEYLRRQGFTILGRNIAKKTGELDIIAQQGKTLHFVEVKTLVCNDFATDVRYAGVYGPSENLHKYKIRKVARTAEWYVAEKVWKGDWQVDGILVWVRRRDGLAKVRYLPQIIQ